MTLAIWVLALGVIALAIAIAIVGWTWATASRLDVLSDEEIAERLAPCVAAELIVMQTQVEDPS